MTELTIICLKKRRTVDKATHRDADAKAPGDLSEVHSDLLRPHTVNVGGQKEAVLQAEWTKARASTSPLPGAQPSLD